MIINQDFPPILDQTTGFWLSGPVNPAQAKHFANHQHTSISFISISKVPSSPLTYGGSFRT